MSAARNRWPRWSKGWAVVSWAVFSLIVLLLAAVIVRPARLQEMRVFGLLTLLAAIGGLLVAVFLRQWRALRDQQRELAAIVGSAQEAIIGHLTDGTVTSWNPMAAKLFGFSAESALGRRMADLIVPAEEWGQTADWYARAAGGQAVPLRETRWRHRDGRSLDVMVSVARVRTGAAGEVRLADIICDISQRKADEARVAQVNALLQQQMEHELLSARDHLSIATEVAELGVWQWHLDDDSVVWNGRMFELYGYPPSPYAARVSREYWRARVHPDDLPAAEAALNAALAGGAHYAPVYRLRLPDGRTRVIQAAARVERDVHGQPLRVIGINRDITAQREYEDTLDAARELAESANRAKAAFLSNMSHEIRTPMNAILGLAFLLEAAELPSSERDVVRKIRVAGRSLLGIINDILDFSKIEAGNLTLEQAPFSLSDLLDNLSTIMTANASNKDIELVIRSPAPAIDRLVGDALRLEQILINLTGNAIKFTQQGFVEVSIWPQRIDDTEVTLQFAVTDSGIGIAPEKQAALFRPFIQVDDSTTRHFGGTGLGLAISRRLVEMMGGRIVLRSEEGVGSTFSFAVTLARETPGTSAQAELQRLNVFIADDNAIALNALTFAAEGLGWRAAVTSSGRQALAALKARSNIDVVILDWKMPDLSGLAVAKSYREAREGLGAPILLMATAFSREALLADPDAALIDGVVTKPVTPSCLYNAVARAIQQRQGQSAPPALAGEAGERLAGVRLLVVDDSDINQDVALRIFRYEGAEVLTAGNGQEALDWLQQHDGEVDLVLMDIQMPVMDGYEAARRIRQLPGADKLPIVALTAGAFQSQRDAAQAAGMNDYIAKPFDVDVAVTIIRRLCGKEALPPAFTRPAIAPPEPVQGVIAMARGLAIWRETAVYQQYLRKFARDYREVAPRIAHSNVADAKILTHKLKGVAGNLALVGVETAARVLDSQLAAGPPSADAVSDLVQAMDAALAAIDSYAGQEAARADPGVRLPREQLVELFNSLLTALETDDVDRIESRLKPLVAHLAAVDTAALRAAVEDFDFRGAEQAVLGLMHQYFPIEERRT